MTTWRRAPVPDGNDTDLLLDVLLEAGLSGSIPVTDDEMRPTMERDDRVIVTPFLGLPRPGQMVMARHQGRIVVRRLIEVRMVGGRRRYCLSADAAPGRRLAVLREDLIGRPTAILRRGILCSLDDDPGAHQTSGRSNGPHHRDR